jgi:predicted RNase H-like nuclease (RuvC/YqgF family)
MTPDQKFARWAERELLHNIDHLILDKDDGNILAFGAYEIRPGPGRVEVWKNTEKLCEFSSRNVALSWCVADYQKLPDFALEIHYLDSHLRDLLIDITNSQTQRRHIREFESWEILTCKIQNKQNYVKMLESQLTKCLRRAKYLQLRGFKNETARTRTA